jgi:hypothetical protein
MFAKPINNDTMGARLKKCAHLSGGIGLMAGGELGKTELAERLVSEALRYHSAGDGSRWQPNNQEIVSACMASWGHAAFLRAAVDQGAISQVEANAFAQDLLQAFNLNDLHTHADALTLCGDEWGDFVNAAAMVALTADGVEARTVEDTLELGSESKWLLTFWSKALGQIEGEVLNLFIPLGGGAGIEQGAFIHITMDEDGAIGNVQALNNVQLRDEMLGASNVLSENGGVYEVSDTFEDFLDMDRLGSIINHIATHANTGRVFARPMRATGVAVQQRNLGGVLCYTALELKLPGRTAADDVYALVSASGLQAVARAAIEPAGMQRMLVSNVASTSECPALVLVDMDDATDSGDAIECGTIGEELVDKLPGVGLKLPFSAGWTLVDVFNAINADRLATVMADERARKLASSVASASEERFSGSAIEIFRKVVAPSLDGLLADEPLALYTALSGSGLATALASLDVTVSEAAGNSLMKMFGALDIVDVPALIETEDKVVAGYGIVARNNHIERPNTAFSINLSGGLTIRFSTQASLTTAACGAFLITPIQHISVIDLTMVHKTGLAIMTTTRKGGLESSQLNVMQFISGVARRAGATTVMETRDDFTTSESLEDPNAMADIRKTLGANSRFAIHITPGHTDSSRGIWLRAKGYGEVRDGSWESSSVGLEHYPGNSFKSDDLPDMLDEI